MLLKRLPRPQLSPSVWTTRSLPSIRRWIGNDKSDATPKGPARSGLFELLFPEESKTVEAATFTKAELVWKGQQTFGLDKLDDSKIRTPSVSEPTAADSESHKHAIDDLDSQKRDHAKSLKRQNASVLVLANVSKSLSESDFMRLAPRGLHIDTWASGILQG